MINVKKILDKLGINFTKELEQNIQDQTDIDGKRFKPSKGSIKGGKVVQDGGTHNRLSVSGRFKTNAYKYNVKGGDTIVLYVNKAGFQGGLSYEEIVMRNNNGTSTIPGAPQLFPMNDTQLRNTESVKEFEIDLIKTVEEEFKKLTKNHSGTIRL